MLNRQLLNFEDELYEVIDWIRESDMPIIETWKEHLRADRVFKKNGLLYFCRLIPEAEIVPETETTEIPQTINENN